MSLTTERPAATSMQDITVVEPSCSAVARFALRPVHAYGPHEDRRSEEEMHATLEVNLPNYASAIVNTRELLASISPVSDDASGSVAHALQ